jgi:hypothetical protein
MEKNFRETLVKQLKNPEFKTEWDALEPEYQLGRWNMRKIIRNAIQCRHCGDTIESVNVDMIIFAEVILLPPRMILLI